MRILNEQTLSAEAMPSAIPAWTWLVLAFALFAVYLMVMENGVVLARAAHSAHELFHDARHFIGVPCH